VLAVSLPALALVAGWAGTAAQPPASDTRTIAADSAGGEAPPLIVVPGRPTLQDTLRSPTYRALGYARMGQSLEASGMSLPAIASYRNALALDDSLPGVAGRLGRLYIKVGDPASAVPLLAREVTMNPGDRESARALGVALSQVGEHEAAIRQLELLTRTGPDDDVTWSALGVVYLNAGRAKDSEAAFRRAIALPPARAREHGDLGTALAAQRRWPEGRAALRRAIASDPADPAPWMNLGNLERDAGRPDSALAAYRAAEARDSSMTDAIRAQARLLADAGRPLEAGEAYRRAIAGADGDFAVSVEVVEHFIREGRPDVALEIARDGVRRDPQDPNARLLHGLALDAAGRTRAALAELRTAGRGFTDPAGRARVDRIVATMRASAPDSLRELFRADSLQHPVRAPR
jgi:tetratricopeptide (TPR) repeat protein